MGITLTPKETKQLKANCLAIKNFLIDLVKDCTANIDIRVDFRDTDHQLLPLGIRVSKRVGFTSFDGKKYDDSYDVYGYIGGLSLRFKESDRAVAWEHADYGVELIKQRQSIKAQFIRKLESDRASRQAIATFVI